jgi:hypothetical protein
VEVEDVPAFHPVDRREAAQQRHVKRQNDDRLGARLAQSNASACVQLAARGGARSRRRRLRGFAQVHIVHRHMGRIVRFIRSG